MTITAADFIKNLEEFNVPYGHSGEGAVTEFQVQQNVFNYSSDTGTANAYVVALTPVPQIVRGLTIITEAANTNTGASTLTVNGTEYSIVDLFDNPLIANQIQANSTSMFVYNDNYAAFILTNPALELSSPVLSITGTANQVIANHPTGNVTLSLPQSIATTSSPTFAALTLTSPLSFGNGGTGLSSTVDAGVFVTSSTGVPEWLANSTSGYVLTCNGTTVTPSWQADGYLTGAVLLSPSGDQTITAHNLTIAAGNLNVDATAGGEGNVNCSQVTCLATAGGNISAAGGQLVSGNSAGTSSVQGILTLWANATNKGYFQLAAIQNAGNYAAIINNASLGQSTTWTIPDPGASTANFALAPSALVNGNLVKASGTAGLIVDSGISASSIPASTVATTAVTSNASYYPLMAASSTNEQQAVDLSSTHTYNPSTGALVVPIAGSLGSSGTGISYPATGLKWIAGGALPSSDTWDSIAYGDGVWVIIDASDSNVAFSVNSGQTWTAGGALASSGVVTAVTYGHGVFVAVARSTQTASYITLPNLIAGNAWTATSLYASKNWNNVTYSNGIFLAVGQNGNLGCYTTYQNLVAGNTWTATNMANHVWSGLSYGNGYWVATSGNTDAYATYITTAGLLAGSGWTLNTGTMPVNGTWNSMAYFNNTFVAVNTNGNTASSAAAYITITNLIANNAWTSTTLPSSTVWEAVTYGNGYFVMTAQSNSTTAYITPANLLAAGTWTAATNPSSYAYNSVTFGEGVFISPSSSNSTSIIGSIVSEPLVVNGAGNNQVLTWNDIYNNISGVPSGMLVNATNYTTGAVVGDADTIYIAPGGIISATGKFTGGLATNPVASSVATTAFGTSLTAGSAVQNTTGYDLLVNIAVTVTAATTSTLTLGVGTTSSPTTNTVVPSFTVAASTVYSFSAIVPNNYYVLVNQTGSPTIGSITTQSCPL